MTWETRPVEGPGPFTSWAVVQVEDGAVVHQHPIPFPYEREADRAAARLNVRDSGITGEPVPVVPEDEARAKRQSRIAELRARMRQDHADG